MVGFVAEALAWSMPSFSVTPAPKDSTRTSAFSDQVEDRGWSSGSFRSSVMLRLLRLTLLK